MQVSHTEGRALYMVDLDEGVKREGNLNKGERSKEGQRGRKEERREMFAYVSPWEGSWQEKVVAQI